MKRPKFTRVDANQGIIMIQCRALGMIVWDLHNCGGKLPDLLCIWHGRCVPVEVKPPGKRDQLTQGERDGLAECADRGVAWAVAEDLDDVLRAFGAEWEG